MTRRRVTRLPALLLALAPLAAGAQVEPWPGGGGIQPNIVNGLPTTDWASVGALDVDGGTCTATLIGCRTLLTAAHCVCDALGSGPACPDSGFLIDPSLLRFFSQHAGRFVVAGIQVAPGFEFGVSSDVALIELQFPVRGIRPSPINTLARPAFGTAGTIVGFGRSSTSGSDSGVKRVGAVTTASCSGAGVSNSTHVCWSFDLPLGPPGSDSNTCFGDSGGPLFADVGAGTSVVGVTSGGSGTCEANTDSFDADVFVDRVWIQSAGGADLGNDACGDGGQVGDLDVTTWTASGTLVNQAFHSFSVPAGTKLLNVSLNGATGSLPNDYDLYLRFGAPPTFATYDCAPLIAGSYESCAFSDPDAGTWHVMLDRFSGNSGTYQVTATLLPPNPPLPPLAEGDLAVSDFLAWEIFQLEPVGGDRAVASSPLRGSGPSLVNPEGIGLDATGEVTVANLGGLNLLRIDRATGDRTPVSGCADDACAGVVGAGPAFLGPRSLAAQSDHRLVVSDRSSTPSLAAVVRVDPASGDRTVLSGCLDPSCSSVAGSGPALHRALGIAVAPGGALLVANSFALFSVDPDSGARSIVSGCTDLACTGQVGSGPAFGQPFDVAVEAGGDAVVTDAEPGSAFRAVFRVDRETGARSILSGCADPACGSLVGAGPPFSDGLGGVGIDAAGDLWVADLEVDAVFHVDAASGDRTLVSGCVDAACSAVNGLGTDFTDPVDVVPVPEPERWLSLAVCLGGLALLGRLRRGRVGAA
jgi:hypothetical protein